jgi:hypothetical protein
MATILGLMTSEQVSSERFKNIRREVFLMYPNGTAPLIGILSLLKDEVTNDPEFKWYEKRLQEQRTTLANISSTIPFYKTVDSTFTTWTLADGNITWTAGTQYGIKVASGGTAAFRASHIIKFGVINAAGTAVVEVQGRVTYVDTANNRMAIVVIATTAATDYDAASNAGREVLVIGSAHAEGALSNSAAGTSTMNNYVTPVNPSNYTQIFRTPYQITRTALKTSVIYDENGVYPDQAKDASTNHMREMEWSFLFGTKSQSVSSDNQTVVRTTGGILYFLALWEAGSTYGNTAATVDTDDNKRIIANTAGTINEPLYDGYLERVFRFIRNNQGELLCLCGSGFLKTMQAMYRGQTCLTSDLPMEDTYGMNVVSHKTMQGTVHYKTHPLFSQNATMRFNALFLDTGNLRYRYLNDSDTKLYKDRAPNNADYIENEWLTEAGCEVDSPESHMYLQNVNTYAP